MSDIPDITNPQPTAANVHAEAWAMLQARHQEAGAWAVYAATLAEKYLADMETEFNTAIASGNLDDIATALQAITLYTPPGAFTYNAPTAPTYETVPAFTAPTMGTIREIPAVASLTIGDVPDATLGYSAGTFSDSLLTALKTRLAADIATSSTGLGNAEAALFARETARQNAIRSQAYTEITTMYSEWPMPPGAAQAQINRINSESTIRLADSSSQIMAESARLAVDYNKHVLTVSTQLLDGLTRIFDSAEARLFDKAKTEATLELEAFKETVQVVLARGELNKTAITATVAANDGTVQVFKAQNEAALTPVKTALEINQTKASTYGTQVQAATSDLNAQVIPEELKLKGVAANAQIAGAKTDVGIKQAQMVLEESYRQLSLRVETLRALAQGMQQIAASALNSISSSTSFGFSGHSSTGYDGNITEKLANDLTIAKINKGIITS